VKNTLAILAALMLTLSITAGCSKSSPEPESQTTPATSSYPPVLQNMGTVEIDVTDAPPITPADHIFVTLNNIEISQTTGGWVSVATSSVPFDLKSVMEIDQFLTTQTIASGPYNEIRFDVASVSVQVGGQTYNATVPSGTIRLVGKFEIADNKTTVIVLDFDADQSLHVTGNSNYSFKPVLRLLTPKAGGVLGITTTSLSNNVAGVTERDRVSAAGGKKPYTFSVTSGALPPGFTLNPDNGVLGGAATQAGTYDFTVQVKDSSTPAQTDSEDFTVRIAPANGMVIATTSLPDGIVNEPYTATLASLFGNPPYTWTITSGSLTPGLTLDGVGGTIDGGTPTQSGDFTFTLQVQDSSSPPLQDTQTLTIQILQ